MFDLEQGHWWYQGLRNLVFSTLNIIFKDKKIIQILDAGCGTGLTLKLLSGYGNAFGIDISGEALKYCKSRGLNRILMASIMGIPFQNESFDLVISNDVLYHKLVTDDMIAIKEIHRVLRENGFLIFNLPAYNFMRRAHDIRIHTRHRYVKNELFFKLNDSKFKIIKMTYRNAFLLFPLLLSKFIGRKMEMKASSDLKPLNPIINSLLYNILRIENLLIKSIDIPFGTSVFCVAQK